MSVGTAMATNDTNYLLYLEASHGRANPVAYDILAEILGVNAKELADAVKQHMSPPLRLIGAGELVSVAGEALRDQDALMVVEEGRESVARLFALHIGVDFHCAVGGAV